MRRSLRLMTVLGAALSQPAVACELPLSAGIAPPRLTKPVDGTFTMGFGTRLHPILQYMRQHLGVDYAAKVGTPIVAALGGKVVEARNRGEYGNATLIDHGGGVTTIYSQMSRFADGAREGTCVNAGDVIGYVGVTGLSTGPHLHFEVRLAGTPVDPVTYLYAPGAAPREQP
jgi:murein DD-endopeptidase MepM/ murein hydrolase activator NlpD